MSNNYAQADYEKIRDNLYNMLEDAMDALELAKEILRESEHPRAVEVYSGLLANVAKINGQILDLAKVHKDVTERKTFKDEGGSITPQIEKQQNVYIGNTADLQKMLKEARLAENVIDVVPEEE